MSTLTVLTFVIIAAANMAVGGCIGICGIAGFLLPMLYTGVLGFDVTYALALSFLAFLVSGIIGSRNYYKAGNLDMAMSVKLGLGSLVGAVGGVFLQSLIEKSTAKTILYLVVLFSGASILVRMWNEKRKEDTSVVEKSVASAEEGNDMAKKVIDSDDILDNLFDKIRKALDMNRMGYSSDEVLDLLMISKYYERIGDHATNIGEWAEFAIDGIHRNGDSISDLFNPDSL